MKESAPKKSESMLALSPFEFDQTENSGWRKFELSNPLKAADLIRQYIKENKDKIENQEFNEKRVSLETMQFHLGQLLASAGESHWPEAIQAFERSFSGEDECWDAYVSATIGFLERNQSKVEEAIKTIEASTQEEKRGGNIGIVKNFKEALERGERNYRDVYGWPREAD